MKEPIPYLISHMPSKESQLVAANIELSLINLQIALYDITGDKLALKLAKERKQEFIEKYTNP